MSTHKNPLVTKNFSKRILDDGRFADGVRRYFLYACRVNDRHRVAVPSRSLDGVPGERCPSCGGELLFLSAFWEGEAPVAGYDPDAAFDAIAQDGYYAWIFGETPR